MTTRAARLSGDEVKQHLRIYPPAVRRIAMELRRVVFREVPGAAEKVAYHCLTYYLPECIWGVIGGNICMMQLEDDAVMLGFIHGYRLEDPEHLLQGKSKHKRHVRIGSVEEARLPAVAALIRAAVVVAKEASLV